MGPLNPTFSLGLGLVVTVVLVVTASAQDQDVKKLPDGFQLGTATAAYQVEGAWNVSGKGISIWDHMMMTQPHYTDDHKWGDVACDSYHNIKRDVEMLKELGLDTYRFSLSWTRILPTGFNDVINQDGVKYYNNLITELQAANIHPVVTLYHWDLPQSLQDLGGWTNPIMADFYLEYAETAFKLFGDKVKVWLTFNEPVQFCSGYAGDGYAPAIKLPGVGDYLCGHTVLRAHAKAYRLYKNKYAAQQGGKVGITLSCTWYEPFEVDQWNVNTEAQQRALQFELGWFAHPIFAKDGNYPGRMRDRIDATSLDQGLGRTRLPIFTDEELKDLQGSADFFGLNHYTTRLVAPPAELHMFPVPSLENDRNVTTSVDPAWIPSEATEWLKVVPWGIKSLLNFIRTEYDNPPVYITENGFSDLGQLDDYDRVKYYRSYLSEVLNAIYENGCNVIGYTAWSLMDNFEWRQGYSAKFGLYQVNFTDPARTRTPKRSVAFFQELAKTRRIPEPKP